MTTENNNSSPRRDQTDRSPHGITGAAQTTGHRVGRLVRFIVRSGRGTRPPGRVSPDVPASSARLYERHASALFGYVYRLAGDRMIAEEILQDTMLAVWRSAAAFEGRSKVTTWLFGVARRQAHNRLRGRSGPEPTGADLFDRPDQGPGPEELAIAAAGGTSRTGSASCDRSAQRSKAQRRGPVAPLHGYDPAGTTPSGDQLVEGAGGLRRCGALALIQGVEDCLERAETRRLRW